MQAIPPILPLLDKKSGEVVERSQERHLNLIRFQAELEVRLDFPLSSESDRTLEREGGENGGIC